MAFDDSLVLLDGSVDYNAANDGAATSVDIDAATGAKVIDIGETGAAGLTAVLLVPDDHNGDTDTLTAFIEASSVVGFGSDVSEMGKFDVLATAKGIIVGSEGPCEAFVHFATDKRYIRLNGTVGTYPDDFGAVKCYLTPHAYKSL